MASDQAGRQSDNEIERLWNDYKTAIGQKSCVQKAPTEAVRDGDDGTLDDMPTTSLFASLGKLYASEKYSDMNIVCGGETFHAHRAVVCSQSPFFDKALSGGFSETISGVVELSENGPTTLRRFLQFLYTGNYDYGATPCLDMPSEPALETPEEVSDQLDRSPGVAVGGDVEMTGQADGSPVPDATAQKRARKRARKTRDSSDSAYSEDMESKSEDEPAEEYNEFGCEDAPDSGTMTRVSCGQTKEGVPLWRMGEEAEATDKEHYLSKSRGLLVHVRIYIMAHIYDVPSLRLLARERFYRAAEPCFLTEATFPDIVDEIYSRTPETDVALREIVCRLTAQGITSEPEFRERMDDVMRKHGDFAVGVLNYSLVLEKDW